MRVPYTTCLSQLAHKHAAGRHVVLHGEPLLLQFSLWHQDRGLVRSAKRGPDPRSSVYEHTRMSLGRRHMTLALFNYQGCQMRRIFCVIFLST